jgi:choice-of-anchor A domain-containing protein
VDRRSLRLAVASATLGVTALAVLLAPPTTEATAAAPSGTIEGALGFNVFVRDLVQLDSGEIEGPLAVGGPVRWFGDFPVASVTPGDFIAPGDSVPSALVAGQGLVFPPSNRGELTVAVPSGVHPAPPPPGYAKVGRPSAVSVYSAGEQTRIVPHGQGAGYPAVVTVGAGQSAESIGRATGIDFATVFAHLQSASHDMAECQNTVRLTDLTGKPLPARIPPGTLAVVDLSRGGNVLNISAPNLGALSTVIFSGPPSASATLLVNVDVPVGQDQFTWAVPRFLGASVAEAPYLLWNFPGSAAVVLNGAGTLPGTVLGPRTELGIFGGGTVIGQVVADELAVGPGGDSPDGNLVRHAVNAVPLDCADPTPTEPEPSATPTASPSPAPTATGSPSASPYGRPPRP